jgi:hypothetical protein
MKKNKMKGGAKKFMASIAVYKERKISSNEISCWQYRVCTGINHRILKMRYSSIESLAVDIKDAMTMFEIDSICPARIIGLGEVDLRNHEQTGIPTSEELGRLVQLVLA